MNYQRAIFSQYLADEEMMAVVSDESFIKKMLEFQAALATAQANVGLVPPEAAQEISRVLSQLTIEPGDLSAGTLQNGIPVITLLELAREKLPVECKKHLHYGATSQDVVDTAWVLVWRDAIKLIEEKITTVMQRLDELIGQHGDTPCMARTRGQLAIPITFAGKVNAWLQPLQRQVQRLPGIRERLLVVQLGGAAGTLSVYPHKAVELRDALAKELRLQSTAAWHTQRDNISEFTNWLAMTTGVLGKMGADILVMTQSEINELVENTAEGGKSSAMPHKSNPVLSEALVAMAKINAGLQSQVLLSMLHTNERDATAWILEWNAIPQMLVNNAASLHHALTILTNMKVNTGRMKTNVEAFLKSHPPS